MLAITTAPVTLRPAKSQLYKGAGKRVFALPGRRQAMRCALVTASNHKPLAVNILKAVSTGAAVAAASTLVGSSMYYQQNTMDYKQLAKFHTSKYARKLGHVSNADNLRDRVQYAPSVMTG